MTLYGLLRQWLIVVGYIWAFYVRVLGPSRAKTFVIGGFALSAIVVTIYEATT